MANTDSRLLVADLDFDKIKNNLKAFLSANPTFTDYNFDASALSIIVDTLAYNTHLNSYYLNMIGNEMFLDTAVVRDSIVSQAKTLGYTPTSATSAQASINLSIQPSSTYSSGTFTLPRFTAFLSGPINGVNYEFLTTESYVVSKNINGGTYGSFDFYGISLYEGKPQTQIFSVVANSKQEFILPDSGIDTRTIQVLVQKSSTDTTTQTFTLATDATEILSLTSNVYYIEEYSNLTYKIYFGDDIIGAALNTGNIVIVSYLVSSQDSPNGASSFTMMSPTIAGASNFITTVTPAAGGSAPETISSIKFSAPKNYASQNRAVTKNDYIAILNKKYPYFDAINVWGGEEMSPPEYGKVYISVKPKSGYVVSQTQKQYVIDNILKPYGVLTVTPEIVDPDYTFLNLNVNVIYDPKLLLTDSGTLKATILNAIKSFVSQNLNTFNSSFYVSQALRSVDNSDPSILASEISFFLEKRFVPILGTSQNIKLNFGTELQRFSGLQSTGMYSSPAFTTYDSTGTLQNAYLEEVPQSFTGINSIKVTNPGSGYISTPNISIVGDGTGAVASAIIVNGQISQINVTNPGTGYTTARVYIYGDSTTNATADALINGALGLLRTYYFDSNNNKKIIGNAGTIDYINGVVTITNLNPISILNSSRGISFHAKTINSNILGSKNRIITLDFADSSAVSIILTPVSSGQ